MGYKGMSSRPCKTGTRQLGTCQIRHRLKEQIRPLLKSAPVKFDTYILQIRHLGLANSAPDSCKKKFN